MSRLNIVWCLAVLLMLGIVAQLSAQSAPTFATSGLLIYNVWVRPTAPALAEGATPEPPLPGTTTSVYMTIENTSDKDYQLVAVNTDAAEMTHVHETTMEGDLARMQMISTVDIPAGETVTLAPLGFHVMLMNITRDIYPGDAVAFMLTFADDTGATFDMPLAALATDFPPPEDPLIIANAAADANDDGTLNVSLLIDNHGNTSETLTTVTSVPASTTELQWREQRAAFLVTAIQLPPQSDTDFAASGTFVHIYLSEFAATPSSAITLTLEFESGKTFTIAVPIIGAAS